MASSFLFHHVQFLSSNFSISLPPYPFPTISIPFPAAPQHPASAQVAGCLQDSSNSQCVHFDCLFHSLLHITRCCLCPGPHGIGIGGGSTALRSPRWSVLGFSEASGVLYTRVLQGRTGSGGWNGFLRLLHDRGTHCLSYWE